MKKMFMLCMVMSLLLSVTSVSAEDKDYIFVTGYGTLTGILILYRTFKRVLIRIMIWLNLHIS